MTLHKRIDLANKLEKNGEIRIGNDLAIDIGGLVKVISDEELVHPIYETPLENPMTWDTFTHLYLLNK